MEVSASDSLHAKLVELVTHLQKHAMDLALHLDGSMYTMVGLWSTPFSIVAHMDALNELLFVVTD